MKRPPPGSVSAARRGRRQLGRNHNVWTYHRFRQSRSEVTADSSIRRNSARDSSPWDKMSSRLMICSDLYQPSFQPTFLSRLRRRQPEQVGLAEASTRWPPPRPRWSRATRATRPALPGHAQSRNGAQDHEQRTHICLQLNLIHQTIRSITPKQNDISSITLFPEMDFHSHTVILEKQSSPSINWATCRFPNSLLPAGPMSANPPC